MDIKKLYKAAKTAGFSTFEARISSEERIQIDSNNGEQESYIVAGNGSMTLRGIIDGKCGSFSSDRVDDEVIGAAVAAVKESACYGQPVDAKFYIKGGEYKYEQEKVQVYKPALDAVPSEKLCALCCSLGKKAMKADKRIVNTGISLEYICEKEELTNSNGLDLRSAVNYLMVFASCAATADGETQSGSHYAFVDDFDAFDEDEFVKELIKRTVGQFGGQTVKSGKYKVVYSPDCLSGLLQPVREAFSGFNVEQHVSALEGKLGQKLFSDKITLSEKPIGSELFCTAFDSEGVPCANKALIDKGVPTGFVYDLGTADRAGVKSTGNGRLVNGNVRPTVGFTVLEEGDKTIDGLFKEVGDGLYITTLAGQHAGIDQKSGAYSLQAAGFVIEKGKLSTPVSLITVAGNIFTDLNNVIAVGNDSKLTYSEVKCPSVAVNDIAVSGK